MDDTHTQTHLNVKVWSHFVLLYEVCAWKMSG